MKFIAEILYLIAALLFVVGLKKMSKPTTARNGNFISAFGMLLAIVGTLIHYHVIDWSYIVIGMFAGSVIGTILALTVKMTAMPQMVALLNGFGGLASLLVGFAEYNNQFIDVAKASVATNIDLYSSITIFLTVLVGGVTFSGSVVAWAKLQEVITGRPILFRGQQFVNAIILIFALVGGIIFCIQPMESYGIMLFLIFVSFILGITSVIPIGGADMPVVISLLNSYSGIAACLAGFVIQNNALIVTGSLVGASGIILTNIMCKAMNRSLTNVLFSGFGAVGYGEASAEKGEVKPINVEDTYALLEAARAVCIVPGYGLAVAQAQHVCRELADLLEKNGAEVYFAIHPVAGRMPGHMNVLLAEANVSYDKLYEMDAINPIMERMDVTLVIGANDVVNPAAREDKKSPIYGMPIINVDYSRTVIVVKRSMATGFAGIPNPLFYKPNTRMLFGDAKHVLQELVAEFKKT